MGRFAHEAVATDHRTGVVYQTDDPGRGVGGGFYRYLRDEPEALDSKAGALRRFVDQLGAQLGKTITAERAAFLIRVAAELEAIERRRSED